MNRPYGQQCLAKAMVDQTGFLINSNEMRFSATTMTGVYQKAAKRRAAAR